MSFALLALDALAEIWQWSAERFGVEQADRYLNFLDRGIDSLASKYNSGTPMSQRIALRWKLLQRRQ